MQVAYGVTIRSSRPESRGQSRLLNLNKEIALRPRFVASAAPEPTMQLTRCKDQNQQTLEQFYGDNARDGDGFDRARGEAMLDLIARLRALPGNERAFGLTSHQRLVLLAEDSYTSPWYVVIAVLDRHNYHIEYLMPEHAAPWSGAYVRGECRTEDDAVEMIETAMDLCEGWG